MLIYNCLKKKKKLDYHKSKEFLFYEDNKKILNKIKDYYDIHDANQDFNIIVFNILIKALKTQEKVYQLIDEYKDAPKEMINEKVSSFLSTRPFLQIENEKIFLPFYSKAFNYLLQNEPSALKNYPYNRLNEEPNLSCINLFDEYGYQIFDSVFTNLVKILEDKTSCAFYSSDFETIYVITNQGTLDVAIKLFDKYLTKKEDKNILIRCQNVMKIYYENKRIAFINSLHENKFISSHMKSILLRKVSKRHIRRLRKQEVKNEKV